MRRAVLFSMVVIMADILTRWENNVMGSKEEDLIVCRGGTGTDSPFLLSGGKFSEQFGDPVPV